MGQRGHDTLEPHPGLQPPINQKKKVIPVQDNALLGPISGSTKYGARAPPGWDASPWQGTTSQRFKNAHSPENMLTVARVQEVMYL